MTIFRKAPRPAGRPSDRKDDQPQDGRRARPASARSASASRRRSSTSARPRSARPASDHDGLVPPSRKANRAQLGEGEPTDQRRRASAGRIIGIGLICFGIWLVFDANQLYHAAEAGQIGVRRTVAVTILRPIAAITDALRISGPVNSADSALGRCGIGGAPACGSGPAPDVPPVTTPARRPWGYLGLGGAPHLGPGIHYVPPPPPPVVPPGPPPLVSPTASRPLTLLSDRGLHWRGPRFRSGGRVLDRSRTSASSRRLSRTPASQGATTTTGRLLSKPTSGSTTRRSWSS